MSDYNMFLTFDPADGRRLLDACMVDMEDDPWGAVRTPKYLAAQAVFDRWLSAHGHKLVAAAEAQALIAGVV